LEASSKKECVSMRIHIDKNQFDGNAIALVVIAFLIVIALAYSIPPGRIRSECWRGNCVPVQSGIGRKTDSKAGFGLLPA
jgi:hypothetical protein